jgi:hypothetical protein
MDFIHPPEKLLCCNADTTDSFFTQFAFSNQL